MTVTNPWMTALAPTTRRGSVVGILASLRECGMNVIGATSLRPKPIPWILFQSSKHATARSPASGETNPRHFFTRLRLFDRNAGTRVFRCRVLVGSVVIDLTGQ